jgi:hypothetical protein
MPLTLRRSFCLLRGKLFFLTYSLRQWSSFWGTRKHLTGYVKLNKCHDKFIYSGCRFWLQIQRFGFDSWLYQIFWGVVGLELGPLSLVSTTEQLLSRKSSGSGLESREYGLRDPSRWPHGNIYPQKLDLTSLKSGGRSVGVLRSIQATKFSFQFSRL